MFFFEIFIIIGLLISLTYISMIYTSPALLLFTITAAAFAIFTIAYILIARRLLSVNVSAPIGVADAGKSVKLRVNVCSRFPFLIARTQFTMYIRSCFDKGIVSVPFRASDIVKGENVFDYEIQLKEAGCYEIGVRRIQFFDITGLVFVTKKMHQNTYVQVLPEITDIVTTLSEPVRNFYGEAEVFDEDKSGDDNSETFNIREYVPGDKLQSIHWKLSAKEDELIVKEMSQPKACPVVLFLEYKKSNCFDAFLQIVASISFSLMDNDCPHYIAWYEGETGDVKRTRVDSIEGYYQFFCDYLRERKITNINSVEDMYKEKYRSERYLYSLSISEKLKVKQGELTLLETSEENVKKDLGGLVIVF